MLTLTLANGSGLNYIAIVEVNSQMGGVVKGVNGEYDAILTDNGCTCEIHSPTCT
ncbi:hypothetical protein M404DRAFT_999476 [Pisolithus tinctorius Marx 270]|uniref:Uncharacterized protein n=1 Tax=Pisolithus tinctorius Marx 270 TaxID=870435 RepID=A0A0C3J9M4_PISTI|nr:hypothetical protein M404DRAFT_999476 [Pisolithus tinctorius Marx 270]